MRLQDLSVGVDRGHGGEALEDQSGAFMIEGGRSDLKFEAHDGRFQAVLMEDGSIWSE